tara:strand:- start:6965 stop:9127 length:2163 start_codon:yes stop_codon:yes gene_type:complete
MSNKAIVKGTNLTKSQKAKNRAAFLKEEGVNDKINSIAESMGVSPDEILHAIEKETAGSYSPAQKNLAGGSAVGLIQFVGTGTDKGKGGKTVNGTFYKSSDLEAMTTLEQLDVVEGYFTENFKKKGGKPGQIYNSIAAPSSVGKAGDKVIYEAGSDAAEQNPGWQNEDGSVTTDSMANFGGSPEFFTYTPQVAGWSETIEEPEEEEEEEEDKDYSVTKEDVDSGVSKLVDWANSDNPEDVILKAVKEVNDKAKAKKAAKKKEEEEPEKEVRKNVASDYDYSADGDKEKIEDLLRKEANGESLTEQESDYLYNAQLNNHEVFYEATEASKNTKGIMTDADIALMLKNKKDPDSLTEDEKVALAVINKEGDALRNSLNVQATDDSLVRIDETGGLGPAVKATEETAERTEVETGLIAGGDAEQDATNKALRIAQGEADHDARIKQMLKDTDSYNEDGTLITEEQVKARQAAEDKLNQDKLNAANAEKREGQMRKAEMALTGLKAAAGILSLSQALRAPDVETPELDPLIYEALSKQKALSESGLTAKEKGAAMQNMGDAYAGAMKNVLRASGGQRGMYLANQGTVDAQRIQGLNQLAAQDAAVHRENIKEYNSLATSVGSMKLNRDMNVEQMRQATLSNNRQILSGVGSNLLSDAISDVSYYMNPNRKATEDLIKNLSGKKGKDDGYDNPLLNQKITTANITPEEQAAIDKAAVANAKNTTN